MQHVRGIIPENAFVAARDEITRDRDRASAALLAAEAEIVATPSRERVRSLLEDWDVLPVAQRRAALKELVHRIEVTPGRPASTIEIIPIWDR